MMRRIWRYLFTILLLLMTACNGNTPPAGAPMQTNPSGAVAGPAVVRVGWKGSPDSLNPGVAQLTEAYTLFELVYDSMFNLELDGSYSLDLAESYEVADDGLVWTFTIRPNLKFHDGQSLTAGDIAFSYNFYKANADFPYLNLYTQFFDTIEAPDDNTVVIKLTQAIPNMESQLIYLYVLPEHVWSAHSEGAAPAEFLNEAMIGSGPFKLVEYKQNEFVQLAVKPLAMKMRSCRPSKPARWT
jgi:peptide/nickel transport system substrate-binding protein